MKKKVLSVLLCVCMLLGIFLTASAEEANTLTAGGWNETIWAKVYGIRDAQITAVSYTGTVSGALTGEDLEYLVRDEAGYARIDILGVPAGSYTLTVETTAGTLVQSDIRVEAQDRSGFAHFGDTEGVGAYDNEGRLKENAIVLYVTQENKNTVTVTSKDGTTVSGIGNILNSRGRRANAGSLTNTNQDILRKLATDGTPLVVRIIGTVTLPEGLTAYNSTDYGGSKGDNGAMARMEGGKDITIEGIGAGAAIDGWGLHFICGGGDYARGWGRSFEVRNLSFRNVPEDCVGMEGEADGSNLTAPVERCWIHNCAFYAPRIAKPAESDKDGGDGACDFKRGQYFTNSYCYYEGYHKTNLVGAGDGDPQYHLTYHHNYWKNCESRGPLARQANIHMYNNIFENQSSYCMNPRANAYIFSEFNLFLNSKNPVQVKQGAVKSYGDSFTSCAGDNHATIVTDKSTQVATSCKYANFDTNAAVSYIPSGDYILQESIAQMKAVVLAQAGPQPEKILSAGEVNTSVIPAARYPVAAVELPYNQSLNRTYITSNAGTYDNVVFNVSKTAADSVTVGGSGSGCDIVFYADTAVNISMTEVSGTNSPILCNAVGECLIVGTGTAYNLPAGYYFIQSGVYDPGSGKYKEAKLSALAITAYDPNAPIAPIPPAPDDTEPSNPGGGGNGGGGEVTIPAGSYVHSFTENEMSSDFFTISGNLSTSKGSVSFAGLELTTCLKIESATSISFVAPESGTLTLVFGGTTNAAGKKIKIDGEKQTIGDDNILTWQVTAGSHTITKGDSINLFYMAYTSDSTPQEHVHDYTEEVTKAATCAEAGEAVYTCACGDSYTKVLPVTAHSYEVEVQKPTCTEGGGAVHTCSVCGKSYTDAQTAPIGHSYVAEVTAPTCTEDGYTVYTCANCGDSYTEVTTAATGHKYQHDPHTGILLYTCSVCGHSYQDTGSDCSHEYGPWVTVKEPTAKEAGERERTCTLCGVKITGPIPAQPDDGISIWFWVGLAAGVIVVIAVAVILKKRKAV